MAFREWIVPALTGFYVFLLLGGMGAYLLFGGPPDHVAWTAPVFMLLAGILAFWYTAPGFRWGTLVAGLVGFGAEVMGVHTGFPFGGYEYTDAFAPHLFEVPLVLCCAWMVLIAYVREMLRPLYLSRMAEALAVGLWMVGIDLLLDPVAAGPLGLWVWDSPGAYFGIPAVNFLGWFLVSALICLIAIGPKEPSPGTRWLGLSIILFFLFHAFTQGLFVPGVIGLAVLGIHPAVNRLARQQAPAYA